MIAPITHLKGSFSLHGPPCAPVLWVLFLALTVAVTADAFAAEKEPARISLLIATGMPGGTYHQIGLGMASLWTTKLRAAGIRVSAADSEGSLESIEAIRITDADMILAENLFCSLAYQGKGIYKGRPLKELRAVTTLWPDTVHLLVRQDKLRTGTLRDLEGLTLATGLPDSGNRFTTELLLRTLKSGRQKVRLRSMSNLAAAEALRTGTIQAIDLTGGIPIPLVLTLFREGTQHMGFLEIPDETLEAVRQEGWQDAFRSVIPADTYPGQDRPVNSVGQLNVLATTAALDPQVVYAVTKTLYENLEYLAKVHPACRQIVLEKALEGLNIPLHRGAILYFTERNVKIPEHLFP